MFVVPFAQRCPLRQRLLFMDIKETEDAFARVEYSRSR